MEYVVDLTGAADAGELHRRVRAALPCPAWYGDNLDALYDLLTDQGGGWQVTFRHAGDLPPDCAARLRRLCRRAAAETPGLKITFQEDA